MHLDIWDQWVSSGDGGGDWRMIQQGSKTAAYTAEGGETNALCMFSIWCYWKWCCECWKWLIWCWKWCWCSWRWWRWCWKLCWRCWLRWQGSCSGATAKDSDHQQMQSPNSLPLYHHNQDQHLLRLITFIFSSIKGWSSAFMKILQHTQQREGEIDEVGHWAGIISIWCFWRWRWCCWRRCWWSILAASENVHKQNNPICTYMHMYHQQCWISIKFTTWFFCW